MEDNNIEFQMTFSKIVSIAWIITLVVSSMILIVSLVFYYGGWFNWPETWYSWPISFILGSMVNLFAFNLLKNNIGTITGNNTKGITNSFSNYVIRMASYGFILYIAIVNSTLNPYLVASGFLTVRIAIYIYSFSKKNKE